MNTATAEAPTTVPVASSPILHQAIHAPDLDTAFKTLQDALGIKTGDIAGMHCQKNAVIDEVWKNMPSHQRIDFLGEYLLIEASYSQ